MGKTIIVLFAWLSLSSVTMAGINIDHVGGSIKKSQHEKKCLSQSKRLTKELETYLHLCPLGTEQGCKQREGKVKTLEKALNKCLHPKGLRKVLDKIGEVSVNVGGTF